MYRREKIESEGEVRQLGRRRTNWQMATSHSFVVTKSDGLAMKILALAPVRVSCN